VVAGREKWFGWDCLRGIDSPESSRSSNLSRVEKSVLKSSISVGFSSWLLGGVSTAWCSEYG